MYCKNWKSNTETFLILKEEIEKFQKTLRSDAQTLSGTSGFHQFVPGSKQFSLVDLICLVQFFATFQRVRLVCI